MPLSKRPGLLAAIEMIEAGRADQLVVAYFDRLVCSLKVQLEVIERVERAGGEISRSTKEAHERHGGANSSVREARRREPAVVCEQPSVVRAHNSGIAGGDGHAVGATIATVAKHNPASAFSLEQSDRQLSAGASRRTGRYSSVGASGEEHVSRPNRKDLRWARRVAPAPSALRTALLGFESRSLSSD